MIGVSLRWVGVVGPTSLLRNAAIGSVAAALLSTSAISQVAPSHVRTFESLPAITIPQPSPFPALNPSGGAIRSRPEAAGEQPKQASEPREFPDTPGKVVTDIAGERAEDKFKDKILEKIRDYIVSSAPEMAGVTAKMLKASVYFGYVSNAISAIRPVPLADSSVDTMNLGPNGPEWVWMPGIAIAKDGLIKSIGPGSWICRDRCDDSAPPPSIPETRHVGDAWSGEEMRPSDPELPAAAAGRQPDAKAKAEADAKAKAEVDARARAEAEARARTEAEARARGEAEARARTEAAIRDAQADMQHRQQEQQQLLERTNKANAEAGERARREAEAQTQRNNQLQNNITQSIQQLSHFGTGPSSGVPMPVIAPAPGMIGPAFGGFHGGVSTGGLH